MIDQEQQTRIKDQKKATERLNRVKKPKKQIQLNENVDTDDNQEDLETDEENLTDNEQNGS